MASSYQEGHRPPNTPLIFFPALPPKNLVFMMTGCFGSFPFPRTLQQSDHSTSVIGAALVSFGAAFARVCSSCLSGWQLGRGPGSCLSGDASYQLFLGDVCPSSSCGSAASITSASWVLLGLANVAVAHAAPKFLSLPQSDVSSPDKRATLFFKRKKV